MVTYNGRSYDSGVIDYVNSHLDNWAKYKKLSDEELSALTQVASQRSKAMTSGNDGATHVGIGPVGKRKYGADLDYDQLFMNLAGKYQAAYELAQQKAREEAAAKAQETANERSATGNTWNRENALTDILNRNATFKSEDFAAWADSLNDTLDPTTKTRSTMGRLNWLLQLLTTALGTLYNNTKNNDDYTAWRDTLQRGVDLDLTDDNNKKEFTQILASLFSPDLTNKWLFTEDKYRTPDEAAEEEQKKSNKALEQAIKDYRAGKEGAVNPYTLLRWNDEDKAAELDYQINLAHNNDIELPLDLNHYANLQGATVFFKKDRATRDEAWNINDANKKPLLPTNFRSVIDWQGTELPLHKLNADFGFEFEHLNPETIGDNMAYIYGNRLGQDPKTQDIFFFQKVPLQNLIATLGELSEDPNLSESQRNVYKRYKKMAMQRYKKVEKKQLGGPVISFQEALQRENAYNALSDREKDDMKYISTPGLFWSNLKGTDKTRLVAALGDLGGLILSATGFTPAAMITGLGTTSANFLADMADDKVSGWDALKGAAIGTGLSITSLLPGGGVAKAIRTVSKAAPILFSALQIVGASQGAFNAVQKIALGDISHITRADFRDLASALSALNSGTAVAKVGIKGRFGTAGRIKELANQKLHTFKATDKSGNELGSFKLNDRDIAEINQIGKLGGQDAARSALLSKIDLEGKGDLDTAGLFDFSHSGLLSKYRNSALNSNTAYKHEATVSPLLEAIMESRFGKVKPIWGTDKWAEWQDIGGSKIMSQIYSNNRAKEKALANVIKSQNVRDDNPAYDARFFGDRPTVASDVYTTRNAIAAVEQEINNLASHEGKLGALVSRDAYKDFLDNEVNINKLLSKVRRSKKDEGQLNAWKKAESDFEAELRLLAEDAGYSDNTALTVRSFLLNYKNHLNDLKTAEASRLTLLLNILKDQERTLTRIDSLDKWRSMYNNGQLPQLLPFKNAAAFAKKANIKINNIKNFEKFISELLEVSSDNQAYKLLYRPEVIKAAREVYHFRRGGSILKHQEGGRIHGLTQSLWAALGINDPNTINLKDPKTWPKAFRKEYEKSGETDPEKYYNEQILTHPEKYLGNAPMAPEAELTNNGMNPEILAEAAKYINAIKTNNKNLDLARLILPTIVSPEVVAPSAVTGNYGILLAAQLAAANYNTIGSEALNNSTDLSQGTVAKLRALQLANNALNSASLNYQNSVQLSLNKAEAINLQNQLARVKAANANNAAVVARKNADILAQQTVNQKNSEQFLTAMTKGMLLYLKSAEQKHKAIMLNTLYQDPTYKKLYSDYMNANDEATRTTTLKALTDYTTLFKSLYETAHPIWGVGTTLPSWLKINNVADYINPTTTTDTSVVPPVLTTSSTLTTTPLALPVLPGNVPPAVTTPEAVTPLGVYGRIKEEKDGGKLQVELERSRRANADRRDKMLMHYQKLMQLNERNSLAMYNYYLKLMSGRK